MVGAGRQVELAPSLTLRYDTPTVHTPIRLSIVEYNMLWKRVHFMPAESVGDAVFRYPSVSESVVLWRAGFTFAGSSTYM